jgi:hypothetical protein
MQGISDGRLKFGNITVLANPAAYTYFETVVNFFTTLLNEEESMAVATRSHQRNVLSIKVTGNRNDYRAPRGGGRSGRNPGRGRGGRTGRGGRHQGGRHNTSNVSDRSFTKEKWIALSYEDKQKVRDQQAKRNL